MDKAETRKGHNQDLIRKLLIAISYGMPIADLTAEVSIAGETVVKPPLFCDDKEKYRSKLISISYSPSSQVEVLPLLPMQLEV